MPFHAVIPILRRSVRAGAAVGCHFYVIFYDGRGRSRQYPMQWQKTGEGGREGGREGATAAFGFRSPLYLIDNIERGGLELWLSLKGTLHSGNALIR